MKENETWCNCDKCGKEIKHGSAYVSIDRHIEQFEDGQIKVIDAVALVALCGSPCGNAFDTDLLMEIIKGMPLRDPSKY